MSEVTLEKVEMLVRSVLTTKEEELGCSECFAVLDRFLELRMEGKEAEEIMPMVQDHLERCGDCHEEYEAILEALRAVS